MIANSAEAWSERAALPSSHEAALWSAAGQQERFRSVLAALEPVEGESILDFGCGTGALSALVPDGVEYVGYDRAPGMRERARRDHPNATFIDLPPWRHFDLTTCIGPFNLRDDWSKERTWETIGLLWAMTARALAACLYAGDDPNCLRYTERDLWNFSAPGFRARRVERHRPNDLLLVLRR